MPGTLPTRRPVLLAATLVAAAFLFAIALAVGAGDALGVNTVLHADPTIYRDRVDAIVAGGMPYVDAVLEHLPVMLLPLFAGWALGELTGMPPAVAYAAVTAPLLVLTAAVVDAVARRVEDPAASTRWLLVATPLFPLVLFRLDAVPVLAATTALWAVLAGRDRLALGATIVGIGAKGWPVVLEILDWWRGRRRRAVLVVVGTVVGLGLLSLLPGFRTGRSFDGIHVETMIGSLVLVARHLAGREPGLLGVAGATYVSVGRWAVGAEALLGITAAVPLLVALRRPCRRSATPRLVALAVLALLLASPLLSAQFLFWPTPFVAFFRRRRILLVAWLVATVTTVLLVYWYPARPLWAVGLAIRNVMLVALVATVARRVVSEDLA
ncbi:MAG TPA: hypothetical protein ENK55_05285 [Actinobacteria bacterium]|nr:hypothetical protein [Actinomycetota bacterium]